MLLLPLVTGPLAHRLQRIFAPAIGVVAVEAPMVDGSEGEVVFGFDIGVIVADVGGLEGVPAAAAAAVGGGGGEGDGDGDGEDEAEKDFGSVDYEEGLDGGDIEEEGFFGGAAAEVVGRTVVVQ
mmetsp:Transcript_7628/g.16059  ORF Transcript_7628/g.16059 Transcript_7628/m.16059 type:complete len:124 (-) Transcript_7628:171-542(-)